MRRIAVLLALGAMTAIVPASPAAATHTGCEHGATAHAHATVPHRNHGTHTAHQNIPYCPPEDAPRG